MTRSSSSCHGSGYWPGRRVPGAAWTGSADVIARRGARGGGLLDERDGWRLAEVLDARLIGDPGDNDLLAGQLPVQGLPGRRDDLAGPGVDLLHGLRDERALVIVLAQCQSGACGSAGMQWPPTPGPGLPRGSCTAWSPPRWSLRSGRDPAPGSGRELVGEGQHHGALEVLLRLGRLGGFQRADRVDRVVTWLRTRTASAELRLWCRPPRAGLSAGDARPRPVMRSGLKATNTSVPFLSPRRSSSWLSSSLVVPTYVVDVRISAARPGTAHRAGTRGPEHSQVREVTSGDRRRHADDYRIRFAHAFHALVISNVPSTEAWASTAWSASFGSAFPESSRPAGPG